MAEVRFGTPIRVITASGYYWDGETQNVHIVGLVTDNIETIQVYGRFDKGYAPVEFPARYTHAKGWAGFPSRPSFLPRYK